MPKELQAGGPPGPAGALLELQGVPLELRNVAPRAAGRVQWSESVSSLELQGVSPGSVCF